MKRNKKGKQENRMRHPFLPGDSRAVESPHHDVHWVSLTFADKERGRLATTRANPLSISSSWMCAEFRPLPPFEARCSSQCSLCCSCRRGRQSTETWEDESRIRREADVALCRRRFSCIVRATVVRRALAHGMDRALDLMGLSLLPLSERCDG